METGRPDGKDEKGEAKTSKELPEVRLFPMGELLRRQREEEHRKKEEEESDDGDQPTSRTNLLKGLGIVRPKSKEVPSAEAPPDTADEAKEQLFVAKEDAAESLPSEPVEADPDTSLPPDAIEVAEALPAGENVDGAATAEQAVSAEPAVSVAPEASPPGAPAERQQNAPEADTDVETSDTATNVDTSPVRQPRAPSSSTPPPRVVQQNPNLVVPSPNVSPAAAPNIVPPAGTNPNWSAPGAGPSPNTLNASPNYTPAPANTIIQRHEVIHPADRWVPWIGIGLVAEHIGRKRADRKLERRFTRNIDRLDRKAEDTATVQARLEQANARLTATQREVSSRMQAAESVASVRDVLPGIHPAESTIKSTEVLATQQTANGRAEAVASSPELTQEKQPLIPQTDALAERHVKPEVVLEKIATAAEKNAPLEKVYERRQEVKDEQSSPVSAGGAAAVSDILSRSATGARFSASDQAGSAAHEVHDASHATSTNGGYNYKTAAAAGAGAALVLLVLAAVAYFIMR